MDHLDFIDRSLINYEKYNQYIGQATVKNSFSIEASRGCPYQCLYCFKIWPKKHVTRSAENLFSELKMYTDMGVHRFSFIDDIFNLDIKNSTRFFQLINKQKLDVQLFFPAGLRGDILTNDYIDLMVEAGTINFALALETASPRLQKLIMKNLDIERLRKNIEYVCEKYPHVLLEIFTMHGFPTETEAEAMMTLDFIKSIKWIHFPYVNLLRIYASTGMENFARNSGIPSEAILKSENLSYHELPETLPFDKSFTFWYQTEFLHHYFLLKERIRSVLPYQMKVLTEDEIVQKYNSYLPVRSHCLSDILKIVGISENDLGGAKCLSEEAIFVPHINAKLQKKFFYQRKRYSEHVLAVLLLDLSLLFSCTSQHLLYDVVTEPLGLMSIATYLNGRLGGKINIRIAKSRIDFDNYHELRTLLDEFKPGVIGIRTLTFYRRFFHETITIIKQWGIEAPIIAGGPYATSSYEILLQDSNIDVVVIGEGEITFSSLVEKIIENGGKLPGDRTLKDIQGIAFIENKTERGSANRGIRLTETEALHEEERENIISQFNEDLENE